MATNIRQDTYPPRIDYPNSGAAIPSGKLFAIGSGGLHGIALVDIAATTGNGAAQVGGTVEYAKAAGAVTVGAPLYYVTASDHVSTADGGGANAKVGIAVKAQASGDATATFLLNATVDGS